MVSLRLTSRSSFPETHAHTVQFMQSSFDLWAPDTRSLSFIFQVPLLRSPRPSVSARVHIQASDWLLISCQRLAASTRGLVSLSGWRCRPTDRPVFLRSGSGHYCLGSLRQWPRRAKQPHPSLADRNLPSFFPPSNRSAPVGHDPTGRFHVPRRRRRRRTLS